MSYNSTVQVFTKLREKYKHEAQNSGSMSLIFCWVSPIRLKILFENLIHYNNENITQNTGNVSSMKGERQIYGGKYPIRRDEKETFVSERKLRLEEEILYSTERK